ncbi:MAG: FMN-binding protein [Chlorobi bacterium]|nr:FMN-binding protein [Chlorobiota bacterium]
MKYLFLFCTIILMGWMPNIPLNSKLVNSKKIDRIIYRLWNLKNSEKEEINIPLTIYENYSTQNFAMNIYKLKHNSNVNGYLIISSASGCRNGGCKAPDELSHSGKNKQDFLLSDNFSFALFFNTNFEIINVTILDYESEYGYEICSKNWLKQFVQIKNENYTYGNNIQAISGATVSAKSITNAISELKEMMKKLKREKLL